MHIKGVVGVANDFPKRNIGPKQVVAEHLHNTTASVLGFHLNTGETIHKTLHLTFVWHSLNV